MVSEDHLERTVQQDLLVPRADQAHPDQADHAVHADLLVQQDEEVPQEPPET